MIHLTVLIRNVLNIAQHVVMINFVIHVFLAISFIIINAFNGKKI